MSQWPWYWDGIVDSCKIPVECVIKIISEKEGDIYFSLSLENTVFPKGKTFLDYKYSACWQKIPQVFTLESLEAFFYRPERLDFEFEINLPKEKLKSLSSLPIPIQNQMSQYCMFEKYMIWNSFFRIWKHSANTHIALSNSL